MESAGLRANIWDGEVLNRVGSGEASDDWGEFDSTEVFSTLRTCYRPPWRPVESLEI